MRSARCCARCWGCCRCRPPEVAASGSDGSAVDPLQGRAEPLCRATPREAGGALVVGVGRSNKSGDEVSERAGDQVDLARVRRPVVDVHDGRITYLLSRTEPRPDRPGSAVLPGSSRHRSSEEHHAGMIPHGGGDPREPPARASSQDLHGVHSTGMLGIPEGSRVRSATGTSGCSATGSGTSCWCV